MLEYDFMRNAFLAGGVVAVVCGAVGFFLVLRNLAFAGHALSHIGFAGATGAALVGVNPLWGLLAFTIGGGVAIGLLGTRVRGRDIAVGIVLTLALGLGVLFLSLQTREVVQATSILFGNVLGVDLATVWTLAALGAVTLVALAAISRPLLFATLAPELAEAKGVSLTLVSVLFLLLVAIAVAEAAQVVGVLLVFALMVAPAATALRLAARPARAMALAIAIALAQTWLGIALAYLTNAPTTFWIVLLGCAAYFAALLWERRARVAAAEPSNRS